MKTLVLLALFSATASAQATHTLFIVDKVSQVGTAHGLFGGVTSSQSESHTAPGVTAEFFKRCPDLSLTQNQNDADLVLQTQIGATTLLDQKGKVLYVSPARTMKNMVKDVCTYAKSH